MTTQCSSLQPYAAVSQTPQSCKSNSQGQAANFSQTSTVGRLQPGQSVCGHYLARSVSKEEAPSLFSVRLGLCHALVLERAVAVVGLLGASFAAPFGVLNQPFEFYVSNVSYRTVLRPRRITRRAYQSQPMGPFRAFKKVKPQASSTSRASGSAGVARSVS